MKQETRSAGNPLQSSLAMGDGTKLMSLAGPQGQDGFTYLAPTVDVRTQDCEAVLLSAFPLSSSQHKLDDHSLNIHIVVNFFFFLFLVNIVPSLCQTLNAHEGQSLFCLKVFESFFIYSSNGGWFSLIFILQKLF